MPETMAQPMATTNASDAPVKVLFIAGWGRSGSTLVGNVLGSVDGLVHLGEVRHVWERGVRDNAVCGCGERFDACPVWRPAFDAAFPAIDYPNGVDWAHMARVREALPQIKGLLPHLLKGCTEFGYPEAADYHADLRRMYQALRESSGARVLVDSSKFPSYAESLRQTGAVDLYLLHLVRDPRASAYSWRKKITRQDGGGAAEMQRFSTAASARKWSAWNGVIELMRRRDPTRYQRLRYEDFIAAPEASVRRVLDWIGEPAEVLPFAAPDAVAMGENHTVWGNPKRTAGGTVQLRMDDAWRKHLPTRDRATVTALTWPFLVKYGYVGG
ncbi:MAG: sulfotransferase [Bacteroidota bacterium]